MVSNHHPYDCLLNRSFRRRSKKTSKLRATGFCEVKSPMTGDIHAQRAGNAENASIWWRHHAQWRFSKRHVWIVRCLIYPRRLVAAPSSMITTKSVLKFVQIIDNIGNIPFVIIDICTWAFGASFIIALVSNSNDNCGTKLLIKTPTHKTSCGTFHHNILCPALARIFVESHFAVWVNESFVILFLLDFIKTWHARNQFARNMVHRADLSWHVWK